MDFCRALIEAAAAHTLCYKLNFGFFEALGPAGWQALARVRDSLPPDIPVIADAKRGDVAGTAAGYARAIFEELRFDAVTVNPYMGWDSLAPWTRYPGKGVLVLCKTSNAGAPHFQDLQTDGRPLYLRVAAEALEQESAGDIGLVVGATYPQSLVQVRALSPDVTILCPGTGAQGGTLEDAIRAGANTAGENLLLSLSRDVIYASQGDDFAEAAAKVVADRAHRTWTPAHATDR